MNMEYADYHAAYLRAIGEKCIAHLPSYLQKEARTGAEREGADFVEELGRKYFREALNIERGIAYTAVI